MANDVRAQVSVLFVCLGNICRSPSAHGVFRALLETARLDTQVGVDSAGTGDWHIGRRPDPRAVAAAACRGASIHDLRARQVAASDLATYDYVVAMDHANRADLDSLARAAGIADAPIALLGDFSPRYPGAAVPDPYFGGQQGFEHALDVIEDGAGGLFSYIRARLSLE